MNQWRPCLALPFSDAELDDIYGDAVRVLAEIGVACGLREAVDRLIEWGAESVEGRLRLKPECVRRFVAERREEARPEDNGPIELSMGGCWAGMHYCDPVTQEVRRATSGDVAQMCRLWDARNISGVVPVVPGDVPPEQETVTAEYIALTNSRYLGGSLTATDPEVVRRLIDMNLAVGRKYAFAEQVGISPLRFNDDGLETALGFLDNPDVDVHLAGFIPMAGASCPLDPRAAAVQCAAEAIAFPILCSALGQEGAISLRIEPMDFQYSAIVFGSPEWCLYHAIAQQVTQYLCGGRIVVGRFRSTAKKPDAHASMERTASVLWQALLGARVFGAVGQISVDEVFSPQQAVFDREILRYVERVVNGLDFDAGPKDSVALIREGVEQGGFMSMMDTAARFRDFYSFPEIFRHWNLGRWRQAGSPSILAEAWDRAQEEIARSTFRLPDDRRRDLDRTYEKALAYIRSRG